MGIFSTSSPFDSYVERATSEKNTSDDWAQIMDVCDRVKEHQNGPKDCLKSINKRLANDNPRVALQAITLLDACINNCGRKFLLEVAGREFEQDILRFITNSKTHPKVASRLRESLKAWAEGEFKGDPELGLITALYSKLQKEGLEFDSHSDSPKKTVKYSNDPNVVSSFQEEEDIAKAIQLSLQGKGTQSSVSSSGLYSSVSAALASDAPHHLSGPEKEPKKVRALYDFEAAEDNELSFKAGEIILILDDADANWWKGSNHKGEGLFPANFVIPDTDDALTCKSNDLTGGKRVSFSDCVEVTEVEGASAEVVTEDVTGEIDEDKINQLLHFLHEADPTGERPDDPALSHLEEQVNAMAPNIDAELERIDKKHAQLARISTDLVDALNLYHQLMREMPTTMPYYSPYKMVPNSSAGAPGMMPPHYMQPSPQNFPNHSMYQPPIQYAPYGVNPQGDMPMYGPVHASGTPVQNDQVNPMGQQPLHSQQPVTNFPPVSQGSLGPGMMQGFPHYPPHVVQPEYGGVAPNEAIPGQMMAPPPSSEPAATQGLPLNNTGLPHGFPPTSQPQGVPMQPPQAPQPNMPQGHMMGMAPASSSQSVPPQAPPVGVPLQGIPAAGYHTQGPASMPFQGPHPNMPQGPPTSMSYYSQQQPHMQSMQQPLL